MTVDVSEPWSSAIAEWRDIQRRHAAGETALDTALAKHTRGLSLRLFDMLTELQAAPRRQLRPQELRRGVNISASGLTRVIDRGVAYGWVTRSLHDLDGRGRVIALTAAGWQVWFSARPVYEATIGGLS